MNLLALTPAHYKIRIIQKGNLRVNKVWIYIQYHTENYVHHTDANLMMITEQNYNHKGYCDDLLR
jgi:16S rRNA G966 N2-methylase RsmD